MSQIRGVAIWLGAPLLASLLCTPAWWLLAKLRCAMAASLYGCRTIADWRPWLGVGTIALLFTIVGSALLSGLFAGMAARSITNRYFILIGFGALAGGGTMLVLGAWWLFIAAGAIYGTVTAFFWVSFHRVTYRSQ